jgi:anti-sigma factor RsiW
VADASNAHDEAALAVVARHALHDEELIAAFVDAGLEAGDADRARVLVERCSTCHDLHRDLVAINAAVRASGTSAAIAAVRPAPRDFRLTPEVAATLRPGAPVARLRDRLVEAFRSLGRPMGASLATLGVVGLLVGTLSLGMPGAPLAVDNAAASAGAGGEDPGALTAPASSERTAYEPGASGREDFTTPGSKATDGPTANTWLLGGSGALLVIGLLLIAVAGRGRRRGAP